MVEFDLVRLNFAWFGTNTNQQPLTILVYKLVWSQIEHGSEGSIQLVTKTQSWTLFWGVL